MGETVILKLTLCVNLQGNYNIEEYIFKHHKHKTHNFEVKNLVGVSLL